jgi:ribosome-binding protein aMBF1 (putative translation factor)
VPPDSTRPPRRADPAGGRAAPRSAVRHDVLAHNVKRARLAAGLTQEDLAHRAGMQTAVYSRIERGDVDPRLSSVSTIAQALGIRIDDLVHGVDQG